MSAWSQRISNRLRPFRLVRAPSDLLLLVQIAGFALVVPALMRCKPERLGRMLEPRGGCGPLRAERVRKIVEMTSAVLWAGRPLLRVSCLPRGLTHYYFLRRAGLDVSLCFGMGRQGESYGGHCWLVSDGEPYLESEDPRPLYTEFIRIPHAAAPVAGRIETTA
ncbi:MAG: hypothetical protein K0Q72_219 [Armatimonadetes bacterium]|jgi:hypothetical protein|nr:hypothetical protein [Armatimonadota bacterium]